MQELEPAPPPGDDRLMLIFTCCHPALRLAGRVALILKIVSGSTTSQVAVAFLTAEAAAAYRRAAQLARPEAVPQVLAATTGDA